MGYVQMVLPPAAVEAFEHNNQTLSQAIINDYGYTYQYDARGRTIEKKLPGAAPIKMRYNARDQLVLSQDGNLRNKNQWQYTKYDGLNRPIESGLLTTEADQATLQSQIDNSDLFEQRKKVNNAATEHGYSNNAFPTAAHGEKTVLSVSYYDDYDFDYEGSADVSYQPTGGKLTTEPVPDARTRGMLTGSKVRVLENVTNPTETEWLYTVSFFDAYGRVIQVQTDQPKGAKQILTTQYDFSGKVIETHTHQHHPAEEVSPDHHLKERNEYDHAGRLTATYQQVNAQAEQVQSRLQYNALGQVTQKTLGSNLQQLHYRYNVRGWLTYLNYDHLHGNPPQGSPSNSPTPLFSFSLHYNDLSALQQSQKQAQYNGNIGGQRWKSTLDGKVYSYAYTYDGASRLKNAYFLDEAQQQNPPAQTNQGADYFEGDFTYDANGNIQNLTRKGYLETDLNGHKTFGTLDALSYNYKGNQLINVTDATNDLDRDKSLGDFRDGNKKANTGLDDYLYDPNGNLLLDHNKNISAITYNHLNLPEQILFGEDGQNYLRFVYDAAGVKLRQEVWQEGQLEKWTDYEGSFIYEQGKLAFFHTAEGRAVAQYLPQGEGTQPTFAYEYIIKDHLGNNRVSFREGETETYLATMDGADNEGGFHNIAETRASLTGHSSQVSKTDATQPEGLWKVLPVSKGDTIQVAVDARYLVEASEQRNNVDINPIVQNTGSGSDNAADNGDTTPEWVLGVSLTPNPQSEDSGVPQAYVQYLLYDETGEVLQSSGQVAISDQAKDGWETLTLEYIAEENGVLQVLALNNSDVEVYFENFQIEYAPTLIAQEQHFYPYGLTMQGLGKQGIPQHRFTYNGKEEVNDFNLGWIDYGWRNMDRALGRWWSIDNKAEKYISLSTYHYAGNNPTRFFDIDGNEFTEDAWAHVNRLIAEVDRKQQNNNNGIAERQALLDAGGLSDRKAGRLQRQINRLEGRNAQLEEVRTGVAELAASSQVYDIQENASLRQTGVVQGAGSVTGKAGFNHSNGNFVIEIPTQSPLHIIAHELQHAHQFENGRYSVGPTLGNNAHRNFLYDQHDELEAYNEWGSLFGGRTFGNINSLPEHYRQYATGPVDVNIFQMTQVILNSDEPEETKQIMLQRIAENTRHAFRVNGQTYYEQR